VVSGNTHAPAVNGSAVLAISGNGIILEANEFGSRTASAASTNVALVETCSDSSLCYLENLFMKANTGFTAVVPDDPTTLLNRGQVRLRPTTKQYTGGVGAHSWVFEDPAPLYRPRNLLGNIEPSKWEATGGCRSVPPSVRPSHATLYCNSKGSVPKGTFRSHMVCCTGVV
jgi:hypothetical protein